MLFLSSFQPCICSGDGGIRTRVPERGKRISSAPRYDHFDTSPCVLVCCTRIRNLRCSSQDLRDRCSIWSAVRVFATCVAHSRASPYSDKLTEYCLHASMTQYPVSLSLHGSLPTRTLYHILGGLQGEVVG